jgi:hypothetical protein
VADDTLDRPLLSRSQSTAEPLAKADSKMIFKRAFGCIEPIAGCAWPNGKPIKRLGVFAQERQFENLF